MDDDQDRPRASAAPPPRPPVRCAWPHRRRSGPAARRPTCCVPPTSTNWSCPPRMAASMTGCSSRTTWYPPLPPCLDPHCLLHTLPTGTEVKSKGASFFSATAPDSGGRARHEEMRLLRLCLDQQGGLCGGPSRACSAELSKATISVEVHPLDFTTSCGKIFFNCWDIAVLGKKSSVALGMYTSKLTYKNVPTWRRDLCRVCESIPIVLGGNKVDVKKTENFNDSSYFLPLCVSPDFGEFQDLEFWRCIRSSSNLVHLAHVQQRPHPLR
ncbi:hypothetical protein QYE76_013898 [Lolium multiflorum]|uniref:GTP-binding nuclear protein n=1 Tax=Lolium multiflorum TaxID=4521 RepID=A0AAD8X5B9_LOLMU|nr:hypothetical protein QYE76_013898 [Lolium multiflorum]